MSLAAVKAKLMTLRSKLRETIKEAIDVEQNASEIWQTTEELEQNTEDQQKEISELEDMIYEETNRYSELVAMKVEAEKVKEETGQNRKILQARTDTSASKITELAEQTEAYTLKGEDVLSKLEPIEQQTIELEEELDEADDLVEKLTERINELDAEVTQAENDLLAQESAEKKYKGYLDRTLSKIEEQEQLRDSSLARAEELEAEQEELEALYDEKEAQRDQKNSEFAVLREEMDEAMREVHEMNV